MRRMHADLLLLMMAAIWGLAFVFQKTAMTDIGPLTFIAARCALATAALAPFAWYESRRASAPLIGGVGSFTRIISMSGLMFFLGAYFQQAGLITASVSNTGFLTALYVVFVPLIAWGWHRIAPSPIIWPAAALSVAGTWLLSGGGALSGLSHGDMLVALSAVFWAAHVVTTGIGARAGRPVLFTCLQFMVVGVLGLFGSILLETTTLAALQRAAPSIVYVGLLSSALAFTILTMALRHAPPAEASILVSTEVLFAALAGAVLLGERLTPAGYAGAGMIMLAALAIQIAPHVLAKRALSRGM